jgi:hypothetical protein
VLLGKKILNVAGGAGVAVIQNSKINHERHDQHEQINAQFSRFLQGERIKIKNHEIRRFCGLMQKKVCEGRKEIANFK